MPKLPEGYSESEMTRPLSAHEVFQMFGEYFGKLFLRVAVISVLALAIMELLNLFPSIDPKFYGPIIGGIAFLVTTALFSFFDIKRRV